ncbi:MAG TPA: siroheme decarboxylase subunit beta [Methanomicrobiales archaeon]|nr:siroheme decarboxylase subunit beta [Methanomicrobiales archaeon]
MDPLDLALLRELEDGLPFVGEPFEEIGKRLDLTGNEVMERIRLLQSAGVIRKFRARIDQRKMGISANALVAWNPDGTGNNDTGSLLAAFPCVTHCYQRLPVTGRWDYTLYTVHHGYSRAAVLDEIKKIAGQIGIADFAVLFSTREFKRVPNVRVREIGGGLL